MPPTTLQRLAVVLAFVAAGLSFAAVASAYARGNGLPLTPLFGGVVMLILGFSGRARLKDQR